MAESTLSLDFSEIQADVGYYAGFGRVPASFTAEETALVQMWVDRGLRRFLVPPPLRELGETKSHLWSFLQPTVTITVFGDISGSLTNDPGGASGVLQDTAADFRPDDADTGAELVGKTVTVTDESADTETTHTVVTVDSATQITVTPVLTAALTIGDTYVVSVDGDYNLPDDFGGLKGCVTFSTRTIRDPLRMSTEHRIRSLRQNQGIGRTGRPEETAVRPRTAATGSTGQRFELSLWPIPDATYVLQYTKIVLVDALSGTNFPVGGMHHAETILASCLAVVEMREHPKNDTRQRYFMERLMASVALDRQAWSPDFYGYAGDRSDDRSRFQVFPDFQVTVNGTLP